MTRAAVGPRPRAVTPSAVTHRWPHLVSRRSCGIRQLAIARRWMTAAAAGQQHCHCQHQRPRQQRLRRHRPQPVAATARAKTRWRRWRVVRLPLQALPLPQQPRPPSPHSTSLIGLPALSALQLPLLLLLVLLLVLGHRVLVPCWQWLRTPRQAVTTTTLATDPHHSPLSPHALTLWGLARVSPSSQPRSRRPDSTTPVRPTTTT